MIQIVAMHTCLLSAKCWNSLMTVFLAICIGCQYLTSHPDRTILVKGNFQVYKEILESVLGFTLLCPLIDSENLPHSLTQLNLLIYSFRDFLPIKFTHALDSNNLFSLEFLLAHYTVIFSFVLICYCDYFGFSCTKIN